ncbi:aldehyde dehydrogenase family 3 member B2 isoform X2 [Eurytemora carolleeae]|uniref:aldehyde dehydrogenase family 3 member B2 isoform X2 n=1 Tax=Eurytemora carolleeae TaxID=1294199 RepID=UPI000C762D17|nr:aldehyde dehydrogenase family 3 member B2 isoform X2 [Eurytemora carolleeae]|eukprot:XP_023334243.1 aldehyde dehydrogenase family 3 member B2-like isoform X2 [Eurytemora affinis]
MRMIQLKNLLRMLDEKSSIFAAALAKDLRKPNQEALCLEVDYLKNDVRGCINNIGDWTQDNYVEKNILTLLDQTLVHYDPLGVVLIMGAWNYPLQLSLAPLAGAISAGNCVIIKPSELAPETAKAIADLIPQYLDPHCFKVVTGGIPETTELLELRFDYIFFTGSSTVGKIVREAANKHLTPVTLELGGKSPVYICDSADVEKTAKRLVWAKLINLGQTCIAPDYVLCSKAMEQKFISKAQELVKEWYGEDPQKSSNLCRIVNRRNFDRLADILKNTKGTVIGGRMDKDDLFIEPTMITGIDAQDSTMQVELFGPIMPFITVKNKEEAVEFINARDKPLSLYVFTNNKDVSALFKEKTSSGSMVINDAIVHLSVDTLPFGGVGPSGMGSYHGKFTFLTFSHQKSVLVRDFSGFGEMLGASRYPPYSDNKIKTLGFLVKNRKIPGFVKWVPYLSCFLAGGAAAVMYKYMANMYNLDMPDWF